MGFHPDRLEADLRHRLGESLRSLWTYDEHGNPTILYTRSDLDPETVTHRIERMNHLYMEESRELRGENDEVLASLEGTVHLFDTVLVMHIAREDGIGGVGFSIEPDVGRNLNAFLTQCSETLHND